jgi:hypothetical protein
MVLGCIVNCNRPSARPGSLYPDQTNGLTLEEVRSDNPSEGLTEFSKNEGRKSWLVSADQVDQSWKRVFPSCAVEEFRLAKAYAERGPGALVSRKRGRPSNRCYPSALRAAAIGIIRERYLDFGPTLAAEKLAEPHDIHLARETVRQWMIAAGLWKDRRARLKAVHQPRYRRDCLGELIQIDGSEHWWFEGHGPQCTLLVYIDDATSRLDGHPGVALRDLEASRDAPSTGHR